MPFTLYHGDSVDDGHPWCPVCCDLTFENIRDSKCPDLPRVAEPRLLRKGTAPGFGLWFRARHDFQHCAEQYSCKFCAILLQIVDYFWKTTKPTSRPWRYGVHRYALDVYQNGSVELRDQDPIHPRNSLGLLLFTPSGHPQVWGRLPPAPAISPSANSKRALEFLRKQLEECSREHKGCNYDGPVLPTRVLDVGSSRGVRSLKLFEPPPQTTEKYIALSYCWGEGIGIQATKSNLPELLRGIDEDELPATVADAVELARHLGLRYLWVDALCIIQDDTEDWLHESAQMSAVYAQAFLTISASSVASSRSSFLHQSRGNKEILFQLEDDTTSSRHENTDSSDGKSRSSMLAVRRTAQSGFHSLRGDVIIDPSMRRAWTLQEHMLSTRLVSFSTDEVQWTCRTLRACECGNPEDLQSPRFEELQRDLDEAEKNTEMGSEQDVNERHVQRISTCCDFWGEIVEAYCRRDLSWMRDKLPALSGVAREFFQVFNEEKLATTADIPQLRYLAGLWNIDFHRGLLWNGGNGSTQQDLVEYRAPSWSWASIERPVHNTHRPRLEPQAEILECVCALANPDDPFGQVVREGTYLRVRGTVLEARMQLVRKGRGWAPTYETVYGHVFEDGNLEEVPLDSAGLGQHSAVAPAADGAEASDPMPSITVRRLPGKTERTLIADTLKKRAAGRARSGTDTESDDEAPIQQKESNLGKQFTVWLLHVADDELSKPSNETAHFLVLGRPAGDVEVYERIGYMGIWTDDGKEQWMKQVSGLAKSTITIV